MLKWNAGDNLQVQFSNIIESQIQSEEMSSRLCLESLKVIGGHHAIVSAVWDRRHSDAS